MTSKILEIVTKIEGILKILDASAPSSPAVAALKAQGSSLLSSILGLVAAHPAIFAGIVLAAVVVIFLPDIINLLSNWIGNLRLACHKLSKYWGVDISELRVAMAA